MVTTTPRPTRAQRGDAADALRKVLDTAQAAIRAGYSANILAEFLPA
jgi:hypothetical protein